MIDFIKSHLAKMNADRAFRKAFNSAIESHYATAPSSVREYSPEEQQAFAQRIRSLLKSGANPNMDLGGAPMPGSALCEVHRLPCAMKDLLVPILMEGGADPFVPMQKLSLNSPLKPIIYACMKGDAKTLKSMLSMQAALTDHALAHLPFMARAVATSNMTAEGFDAIQEHFEKHAMPVDSSLGVNHLWASPVADIIVHEDSHKESALIHPSLQTGQSVFLLAAADGRFDAVSWMVDHPRLGMRDLLEKADVYGHTAMWKACISTSQWQADGAGFDQIIVKLFGAGSDMRALNRHGETLLDIMPTGGRHAVELMDLVKSLTAVQDAKNAIDKVMKEAAHRAPAGVRP